MEPTLTSSPIARALWPLFFVRLPSAPPGVDRERAIARAAPRITTASTKSPSPISEAEPKLHEAQLRRIGYAQ